MSNAEPIVNNAIVPFDHNAVWAHIYWFHQLAIASGHTGKMIVCSFGEDGSKPVFHAAVGDAEASYRDAMSLQSDPYCNLYMPLTILSPDVADGKRGTAEQIVAVLGAVLDEDADKGEFVTPPIEPDYILQSSPQNRQLFYFFDRALSPDEARPLLAALHAAGGGDPKSKDIGHVFRVAGARNAPSALKVKERGRSPIPASVAVSKPWDGRSRTRVDKLREVLAPYWNAEAPRKERKERKAGSGKDYEPTVTRQLNRWDFDECLQLFKDCRAYSDRDPKDENWQAAHFKERPNATKDDLRPQSLNSYPTWAELFGFAAGYEFGPAGRALIDAASYDVREMDGKFETLCNDCKHSPVTMLSVFKWAEKRGIGRRIRETVQWMFRDVLNGTHQKTLEETAARMIASLPPGALASMPAPAPFDPADFYEEPAATTPPLRVISAAAFAGKPVPERQFLISNLIPAGFVGGIYGDGGGGKSLLALMLAVSVATGQPFLGHLTRTTGPVVVLCCEDDEDELHRRIADICAAMCVDVGSLADLHLVTLVDEDAILAIAEHGASALTATFRYQQVTELCAAVRPALVVCDTLADTFAGNENDRMLAKQFVRLVHKLVRPHGGTGIIIAHPSVDGMRSGRGTSGSTGWSNSLRWRAYLERVLDEGGGEPDDKQRLFSTKKNNYGAIGGQIRLRWVDGYFRTDGAAAVDPLTAEAHAETVFLDLLASYNRQGRVVSATKSANYAPTLFSRDPQVKGLRFKPLESAMNRLFTKGLVRIDEVGPPYRLRKSLVVATQPLKTTVDGGADG
jgi:RecA-family ATPase